ncbi:unnamed protein product [Durusdinium trenchii]|uniref:Uncharacterized protein n=1 Tax=Durusdinium trenchii TaxID=1381693 RepID=A0ABP0JE41_9DINO
MVLDGTSRLLALDDCCYQHHGSFALCCSRAVLPARAAVHLQWFSDRLPSQDVEGCWRRSLITPFWMLPFCTRKAPKWFEKEDTFWFNVYAIIFSSATNAVGVLAAYLQMR